MKKIIAFLSFLVAWASVACSAQTILSNTTLSAAVTSTNVTLLTVASATNINAPLPSDPTKATFLVIDSEMLQVVGVAGTNITVARGVNGTQGRTHASGALVLVLPAYLGTNYTSLPPTGSCTRGSQIALPVVSVSAGLAVVSDCLGGQWVNGDAGQTQRASSKVLYAPNPGGTIYTSLNTTGTTLVAGTFYCTEIQLPYSKLITGLAVLNGTTVGTDNHLVALYDNGMNLLASSAAAGVLAATASNYQQISFTAPYYAVGPSQLFGCVQSNGTTATIRMLVTQVQDQYLTTSKTGVFGTIPATITAPTTFTTAVGPYFGLF